jgi:hypothetical protein
LIAGLALAAPAALFAAAGGAADKVPDVVLGPETAQAAPAIEAPIADVTVFSDRARIRRRGRAPAKGGGVTVVRFPVLPGAVFADTVRVSASAGRVLRAESTPIERERLAIAEAAKLLDALDAVDDRIGALDDKRTADSWEVDLLQRLRPAPPVPEDKREGRKNLLIDVGSWAKALDFIAQRANTARARLLELDVQRTELGKERDRLLAEVDKLNRGGFSDRVVEVVAILELPRGGGAVDVELEYFVPGALWKPAYDLHFAAARGQLRVETAAVVVQSTGEDWTDAALSFSTAIPGRGIDLPELLTWTLGERSEFIPQLRPRKPPYVEPPLPAPPPRITSASRALDEQLLRERLARVSAAPKRDIGGEVGGAKPRFDFSGDANTVQADLMRVETPPPAPPPPPEPVAAPAPRRRSMSRESFEGAPSTAPAAAPARAYTTEEAAAPAPMSRRLAGSASSVPTTSVPLALYEAGPAQRGPAFSDPYLPAVSAGGLDYVYQAPTRATIPSSGKQVRIPLATQSFQATAFHEATPALATTAFLRARVSNDGKRPLLRGPATIFGDGELVGVGEVQTTGPGGTIEFPLGADQDVRLVRQIVPTTKTTGVISKSEETSYDVQIQVANYKKQKVTVEIADQVPRSRRDKVEVKLLTTQPAPLGAPDADGVVRWRVELAPGATQTLRLVYQIVRPKDWQLHQQ